MLNTFNGYYAMHEPTLQRWADIVLPRLEAGKDPLPSQYASAIAARFQLRQERKSLVPSSWLDGEVNWGMRLSGKPGVMVLEVKGELARDGNCNMGYEDMSQVLNAAYANPSVRSIVLNINSPGGNCDGLMEVAATLRARNKPVVAFGGFIASAAYAIACSADEVWLDEQAVSEVGSIGVLMVHVDQSEALAKAGYKVSIIRADGSEEKALINGIEPMPEGALAREKQVLNAARREFVGLVRRNRQGRLTSSEWQSGLMYTAKDALRIGLADKVGGLQKVLSYAATINP